MSKTLKVVTEIINGEEYGKTISIFNNGKLTYEIYDGEEIKYNEKGNEIHHKYSKGDEIWYEYDENDNLIIKKDNDGIIEEYKYNDNGMVIYCKNRNGTIFNRIGLDENTGLVCFEYSNINNKSDNHCKTYIKYSNGETGNIIYSIDIDGIECWNEYDNNGNLVQTIGGNGLHHNWEYNDNNQHVKYSSTERSKISNKDGNGNIVQCGIMQTVIEILYEYNDRGDLICKKYNDGREVIYDIEYYVLTN